MLVRSIGGMQVWPCATAKDLITKQLGLMQVGGAVCRGRDGKGLDFVQAGVTGDGI